MKRLNLHSLVLVSASMIGTQASYAEGFERKLNCKWSAESFVNALRVDQIEQEIIGIEIENWSDYYEREGLTFGGIHAAKAKVSFPKSHCIIRERSGKEPYLMACGLGIGTGPLTPIKVSLTSLDGTQHSVTLDTNATFEIKHVLTTSVFESRNSNVLAANFGLINGGDHASVAFDTERSCK